MKQKEKLHLNNGPAPLRSSASRQLGRSFLLATFLPDPTARQIKEKQQPLLYIIHIKLLWPDWCVCVCARIYFSVPTKRAFQSFWFYRQHAKEGEWWCLLVKSVQFNYTCKLRRWAVLWRCAVFLVVYRQLFCSAHPWILLRSSHCGVGEKKTKQSCKSTVGWKAQNQTQ